MLPAICTVLRLRTQLRRLGERVAFQHVRLLLLELNANALHASDLAVTNANRARNHTSAQ